MISIKNLKLYELVKYGVNFDEVRKYIESGSVETEKSYKYFKNLDIKEKDIKSIFDKIQCEEEKFLTSYCLFHFGIDPFIIDIIVEKYPNILVLISKPEEILNLSLNNKVSNNIKIILKDLNSLINKYSGVEALVYEFISESNEDVTKLNIKEYLEDTSINLTGKELQDMLQNLEQKKKIYYTVAGYKANLNEISSYLSHNLGDKKISLVFNFLLSKKDENNSKEEEIEELKSIINNFVEFKEESKYVKLLSEYKISEDEAFEVNYSNRTLFRYVNIKYGFNATKEFKDYLLAFAEEINENLLFTKNYHVFNGSLYSNTVENLFRTFLDINNICYFNSDRVRLNFLYFLDEYKFIFDLEVSKFLTLLNSFHYLEHTESKNFIRLDIKLSVEEENLIETEIREINFAYDLKKLYFKLKQVRESFQDVYHLFTYLKERYSDKMKDKLQFDFPYIIEAEYNFDKKLKKAIVDLQPVLFEDLVTELSNRYGAEPAYLKKIIEPRISSKMKVNNKIQIIENNFLNEKDLEKIKLFMIDKKCFSYTSFKLFLIENNVKIDEFDLTYFIKKLGFKIEDKGIFRTNYDTFEMALNHSLEEMGNFISESALEKFVDLNYQASIVNSLIVLPISDSNYLITNKVFKIEEIRKIRSELVNHLKFFDYVSLKTFFRDDIFKRAIDKNEEIKRIHSVHGETFVRAIILSDNNVFTMPSKEYIVKYGETPTQTGLIKHLVNKHKAISKLDLYEILAEDFDIEFDFNSSVAVRLGFIYDKKLGKIYLNQDQKKKEVLEALKDVNKKKWELKRIVWNKNYYWHKKNTTRR